MGQRHDPNNHDFSSIMELRQRRLSTEQMDRFAGYLEEIFTALGLDAGTPATVDTPQRYLQALIDITAGYDGDPKLIKAFDTECRKGSDCLLSQVIEGPIPVFSLCEHHALPFFGHAWVGYIPHEHIFGISKLNRLVRLYAMRFSVQERIGRQIADALAAIMLPHGVAVYLEAHHLCVEMRGVRDRNPTTRTTHWRGRYEEDPDLRREFLATCGLGR